MPEKNVDLHGSAPDKHKSALLLIDVINDLWSHQSGSWRKYARPMARNLLRLKRRAQKAGVPVIYVNDNFGRWKSDFRRTVEHCARHGRARDVVKLLRPEESDYFVLKPKHAGFFSTTLETLLRYLETQRLILTGMLEIFALFSQPTMPTCATSICLCPRIAQRRTQRKKTILHSRSWGNFWRLTRVCPLESYCAPRKKSRATRNVAVDFEFPRHGPMPPVPSFLKRKDLIDDQRDGAEAEPMQNPFLPAKVQISAPEEQANQRACRKRETEDAAEPTP
jgi:hypothetical protein